MKTLELKLKKDVLIVDAISQDIANGIIFQKFGVKTLSEFEFICKGSELTEEIASELVDETIMYQKHKVKCYRYRSYREGFVAFDNAKESFISAVESKEKFWLENPIKHPKDYEVFPDSLSLYAEQERLHLEAEEKTFRNPLIFVKK